MMHCETGGSATKLSTAERKHRRLEEKHKRVLTLLWPPHQLMKQTHNRFCKLRSLDSLGPDFLSDIFSLKKKNQNNIKPEQDILEEQHLQNSELRNGPCQQQHIRYKKNADVCKGREDQKRYANLELSLLSSYCLFVTQI